MQKGLVSILTPCYNTGNIVHRLLDSVLMQDYPSVEMFAIDDGSTDNTAEVIKSYIPRFQKKGYQLTYVHQKNSGQSVAINNGLKLVKGEYLCWPDSDDYYTSKETISTFVNTLNASPGEVAVVRCPPTNIKEDFKTEGYIQNVNDDMEKKEQFLNCLYSVNMIWPPINYMIKMAAFYIVNPKREIYTEKNAGQNWQMLLPLFYSFNCITLKQSLSCVIERAASHSRGQYKTYEQKVAKFSSYCNTILATLDSIATMPDNVREEYKKSIKNKYKLQELELTIEYHQNGRIEELLSELQTLGCVITRSQLLKMKFKFSKLGKVTARGKSLLYAVAHKLKTTFK